MTELVGRIGFEVELLAPAGASRLDLARELARRHGGSLRRIWHQDSEFSLVPGLGRFLNLTLGFEVLDADRRPVCSLVDDITLTADLDQAAMPAEGWHRVLTDDIRLLRLLAVQCDPSLPLESTLERAAQLWSGQLEVVAGYSRLADDAGATIALAARQGGQRERGCEIVTPPLTAGHADALEALLGPARELGFTVPREAAVHLHFDGAPFRDLGAMANVVRLFAHWRDALWSVLATNPACVRLAPLPEALVSAVESGPSWDVLREAAISGGLTKFHDVNLTQLLSTRPLRDTLEVRILPGSIDAGDIVAKASLVERLLQRCLEDAPIPRPSADVPAADVSARLIALAAPPR